MLKIDQYAYVNRLAHVHPLEKIILAVATMVICLVSPSLVTSLLVFLFMTGVVILPARIPARFYLKLMVLPLGFLAAGVLTVALTITGDAHILLWGVKIGSYRLGVTAGGLVQAFQLFFKALGAVTCLYFLSLTTPMVEIFPVLRKLGAPALLIELMSLVYRFIFVLLETVDKIYTAQASRWGYATWKTSYFSLGQLVSNLFQKSYHDAQMLFMTLMSRCYKGELNVLEREHVLSVRNLLLITVIEAVFVITSLWTADLFRLLPGGAGF